MMQPLHQNFTCQPDLRHRSSAPDESFRFLRNIKTSNWNCPLHYHQSQDRHNTLSFTESSCASETHFVQPPTVLDSSENICIAHHMIQRRISLLKILSILQSLHQGAERRPIPTIDSPHHRGPLPTCPFFEF
jgi:hypothetical protein